MKKDISIGVSSCRECLGRKQNKLFCALADDELENFSEDKLTNFYKKGEVIFHEGDRGHGLYCIYKGKVKVLKLGDEGKEQIVRLANNADVLGYRSLLSDEPYFATATALEDSMICYVSKNKFQKVLKRNSDLSFKTIQLLTNDLKESEKKIINITQKPVIERISEALLILKDKFGFLSDGKTLNVTLSRKEMGDLAGVTPETTIRTLSELNKKRIINLIGKQIQLIDLGRIINLANLVD